MTAMTNVPATLEEALTPQWMTSALAQRTPGVRVTDVEVRSLLHGVATKALVRLTYAGPAAGVPVDLCVKGGFEVANQHILTGGAYFREASFYRDIAGSLNVVTPACYYAGADPETKQGVVVMEDLLAAGATLGSAQRGHSVEEAAGYIDSFAALHAYNWGGGIATSHSWLGSHTGMESIHYPMYTERIQGNLDDERGASLPAVMRDGATLIKAIPMLIDLISTAPKCLTHCDPHAGNLYTSAAGEPGFYDWQTAQTTTWAMDVPYYLCAALSHEDRRSNLVDLLRHYLERLAAHGVTPPSFDEAWLSYRRFVLYGFYNWVITRPTVQPIEVITAFVDRLGTAAAEAESYTALGL